MSEADEFQYVTCPNGQVYFRSVANPSEWTMIEMQGELQSTTTIGAKGAKVSLQDGKSDHLVGLPLGEFKPDGKGKATLRIGNHLLSGSQKKLPKPLLITVSEPDVPDVGLTSQPLAESPAASAMSDEVGTAVEVRGAGAPAKRLRALGVVRSKFVFDTRPAPIVRAQAGSSASMLG